MTVGVSIIPTEVNSNFGRTDILKVGVEKGSSSSHGEGIGFDTTDSTER